MDLLASSHPEALRVRLEAGLGDRITRPGDLTSARFDGAALVPVRARGRVSGAVAVSRPGGEPFTDDELEFVHALADVAGATAQYARSLADSAEVVEDLRQQCELMERISDALIGCDAEGRIVSWNAGAERVYGYPRGEVLGCDVFTLLATRFFDMNGSAVPMEEVLDTVAATGQWHGELHERRSDGAPLTVLCALTARGGPAGADTGTVLVNRDITGLRDEQRTMHDPLTGLPTRRLLTKRLFHALARRHRTGSALAVLFVDLDMFRPLNETYGREAGDTVLVETSRRLADAVRQSDTVWRLGGDQFVVVLEEAGTLDNIRRVTERVMETLSRPVTAGRHSIEVLVSIGGAVVDAAEPGGEIAPETLIDVADEAMRTAKHSRSGMRFTYCAGLPERDETTRNGKCN
nr:diguanylate cyclase [Planosporangium thailandense]